MNFRYLLPAFIFLFLESYCQESAATPDKGVLYTEFSLGITENFNDARTAAYLSSRHALLSFGAAVYLKKLRLSYSCNPVSFTEVKKEVVADDGYRIKRYHRGPWGSKSNYWINFIRHDFGLGCELPVGSNLSITPGAGFTLTQLQVINDSVHAWRYNAARFYGLSLGVSARKYFRLSDQAKFFVGLNTNFYLSVRNKRFPELQNNFCSLSLNCGFKFHPTGKGAVLILKALAR